MYRILIYKKDILKATNMCNIRILQSGALWVECNAGVEDLQILAYNNIWYEVL